MPLERSDEPFAEVEACGTTLSLSDGDVFKVKERDTVKKNGTLMEFKGALSTDVAAADGRSIDEFDNSGPYSVFEGNDGSLTFVVEGPALIYPVAPEEVAAFAAAGLPTVFAFTKGTFSEYIAPDGTVTLQRIPRRVVDVCTLLS